MFIFLIAFGAFLLATVSGFFSVWGLATTFSGVFWSVVAMGVALEYGKLIASSFLYRYWDVINVALKTYLILGVLTLMLLTGLGHFGYLSAGYQTDVLPLKQAQAQISLLEEEKTRILDRKKQIDNLLAESGPQIHSIQAVDGTVDEKATRALRQTTRARENVAKQYRDEQVQVTARMKQLDAELLPLKQELVKTEAHVGPITYIAKALNVDTDTATKYEIFIIILVFDPFAIALTLAANIAIKRREEEKAAAQTAAVYTPMIEDIHFPPAHNPAPLFTQEEFQKAREEMAAESPAVPPVETWWPIKETRPVVEVVEDTTPIYTEVDATHWEDSQAEDSNLIDPVETVVVEEYVTSDPGVINSTIDEVQPEIVEPVVEEPTPEVVEPEPSPAIIPVSIQQPPVEPTKRHVRPYAGVWDINANESKLGELVQHYNYLTEKQLGEPLSRDEAWELKAIEDVLRKHGYGSYV